MTDMVPLVAAAAGSNPGNINLETMRLWSIARGIQRYVELLESDDTVVFVKRLDAVEVVKTEAHDGTPLAGKCQLVLEPDDPESPDPKKREPERIETDWLNQPWPAMIHDIAVLNIGERIAVFKHNTEPDEGAPQGYRRCVWVGARHFPSTTSPAVPTPGEDKAAQVAAPDELERLVNDIVRLAGRLEPPLKDKMREYVDTHGLNWRESKPDAQAVLAHVTDLLEEPFRVPVHDWVPDAWGEYPNP